VYGQPIDPTINMPYNPNQLPSYDQTISLSTHRVASSIPNGGGGGKNVDETIEGGTTAVGATSATTTTTWLYPSPQMFYNALQRKNKLTDGDGSASDTTGTNNAPPVLQPQDIESVVAIHNNMNEKTWYKILQWESIVHNKPIDEIQPKLLKFQGRPMDLSPKAAIKYYLFGHPLPYDRHDWIVERNNGTSQQRYVIDYYYDASLGREDPESAIPDLHDRKTGSPSLLVDVRPALDSVTALYQRAFIMPYAQYMKSSASTADGNLRADDPRQEKYEYLPLWPSSTMKSQLNESIQVWQEIRKNSYPTSASSSSDKAMIEAEKSVKQDNLNQTIKEELMNQFQDAVKKCQKEQGRMNQACSNITDADGEDNIDTDKSDAQQQCAKASIDLTLCMGSILCPVQHAAFRQVVQQQPSGNDDNDNTIIDDALTRLQDCLKYKSLQYQQINKK
jgi:cytochrome c heme-lyase